MLYGNITVSYDNCPKVMFIRYSGFPNPNLSRKLVRNAAKRAEESRRRRHRYDRLIDGARFHRFTVMESRLLKKIDHRQAIG